jgi:LPXTG-site transpeptidase (sortase) family protein
MIVFGALMLAACGAQQGTGTLPAEDPQPTDPGEPPDVPTPLPPEEERLEDQVAPTPTIVPEIAEPPYPTRLEIGSIDLDLPVVTVDQGAEGFIEVPDETAGYWSDSSRLLRGNTVIVGHNELEPLPVFLNLSGIEVGDEVLVTDQYEAQHAFVVVDTEVIQVDDAPIEEAQRTVEYILPTADVRLTLFTCHPSPDECSARLIIVATPIEA